MRMRHLRVALFVFWRRCGRCVIAARFLCMHGCGLGLCDFAPLPCRGAHCVEARRMGVV